MHDFVEVIVDDLSEIDNVVFMNLVQPIFLDLKSAIVEFSEISDVEATIFSDNRELGVVHLLLVGNSELIIIAFSNLNEHLTGVNFNSLADKVFGVSCFNLENKSRASVLVFNFNRWVVCGRKICFNVLEGLEFFD